MTLNDIWKQLEKKSPDLKDETTTIQFTSGNLKKLLRQVYEQGEAEGEKKVGKSKDPIPSMDGMFEQMFGGGRR